MKLVKTDGKPRSLVTIRNSTLNGKAGRIASVAAEALADLARLALAGAERVELAACAAAWLEQMVPGCRAIVFEAVEGAEVAGVLAATAASGLQAGKTFPLGGRSAIAQALAKPAKVVQATDTSFGSSLPGIAMEWAKRPVLVCTGVASRSTVRGVLAAVADSDALAEPAVLNIALLILASHLAVACSVARSRAAAAGASEAIARAKLEWEGTADALADIVCLLDAGGRIVRANRAVELWGLGKVAAAIGRKPHDVLHPGCGVERCPLESAIARAWQELRQDGPTRFEHREADTDTVLHFTFRPMLPDATVARSAEGTLAALVISNVSELHHARDALDRLNISLELKVRTRTQELREAIRGLRNEVVRRKAAESALRASHGELGILSEQLIVAQENERHRIARELHDSVGQSLSAIKYSMEHAAEMLRRPGLGDPWPVLLQAIRGTQEAAESIRTIATNLRPSILDDMGAASAVAGFCRQFAAVYRSLAVDVQVTASDADVPDRLATAVFRSAQELLNNVARHAHAKHVAVELRREPLLLVLEVRDDGVGIAAMPSADSPMAGHGIRNLRERAEMTGGTFELMPGPDGGTVARTSWHLLHDDTPGQEPT